MDTYVITVWIDTNGKTHTAASTIQAGSISEAKAKNRQCKSVTGIHKK